MDNCFIIPLNGSGAGKDIFQRHAGKAFFNRFDNEEILDANLDIDIEIEKSGSYIGVDCYIEGTLTVMCDRCLEDLEIPVSRKVMLSVKFGEEPSEPEDFKDGEREIVFADENNAELDLSQVIYDYSYLCVPLHRTHKDGECNPEALKYLSSNSIDDEDEDLDSEPSIIGTGLNGETESSYSPFASLKSLLKDKKETDK